MNRFSLFIMLLVSLIGCEKQDPRSAAENFWDAVYLNDWREVKDYASESSASSIIVTDEVLPLSELKKIRIHHLKLQQMDDETTDSGYESQGGLSEYTPNKRNFALGDPIVKPDQIIIPTTLFADWEGGRLTWHLNTRLINESGKWKVDFISLKYNLLQQMESETREVLMSEARNFSRTVRETISDSVESMTEQFR